MCLNETGCSVGFVITLFPYSSAKKGELEKALGGATFALLSPILCGDDGIEEEGIQREKSGKSRAMRETRRACIKE